MEALAKSNPNLRSAELADINREWRAYNDASTWLAETLNGRMRTRFEYSFDGRELHASDGGELGEVFEKSIIQAEATAATNPDLEFELRRRHIELEEYRDMLAMARGELPNTMIVISDFPPELMDSNEDVGGYNVARQQTMLRVITRQSDGRLIMQSQSLDGSNRQALEAIYASFGITPEAGELLGQRVHYDEMPDEQEFVIDKLTGVYDRSLEAQTGLEHVAGQPKYSADARETYEFVKSQSDLIDYLVDKMLAGECDEQVLFSVSATMASRYESEAEPSDQLPASTGQDFLQWEIELATKQARRENRTFSACGGSVSGGSSQAESELSASGFGNKSDKPENCEFTSKKCPVCGEKNAKTKAENGKYYHIKNGKKVCSS